MMSASLLGGTTPVAGQQLRAGNQDAAVNHAHRCSLHSGEVLYIYILDILQAEAWWQEVPMLQEV